MSYSASSLTALLSKPTLVKSRINFTVAVNKPKIPKPAGPIIMVTTLVLITDNRILKTCTPPKSEVAFII